MKTRVFGILIAVVTLTALILATPARKVIAQTAANYFTWGYGDDSSLLSADQGGAIELGQGSQETPNPITNGAPYIDFHYGTGQWQDFNYRISNSGNQILAFMSGSSVPLVLEANSVQVNGGVDASGTGIKHARTNSSCTTGSSVGNTCAIVINWPGTGFADTNYTATCNAKGNPSETSFALLISDSNKGTTSMTVEVENVSSTTNPEPVSVSGLNCIAIHD